MTTAPRWPHPLAPPAVATIPVVDDLAGIQVTDPYRWMESDGPALRSFLEAQEAYATAILRSVPGREALRDALLGTRARHSAVIIDAIAGPRPRVFFRRQSHNGEAMELYYRDGWNGADHLVFAPPAGTSTTIDFVSPSPAGDHVALGLSTNGSEDSVVRVVSVASGTLLPDQIDRAQYAFPSWRKDAMSFYYWRRARPVDGAPRAEWFKHSQAHLHVLGQDPDAEPPLLGSTSADLGVESTDFPSIHAPLLSRWTLGLTTKGGNSPLTVFVAAPDSGDQEKLNWRRIAGPADGVRQAEAHEDDVFLLTSRNAPRFQVLRVDPRAGDAATGEVVVPESEQIIESIVAARDGLYLKVLDDGVSKLRRVRWRHSVVEDIPLPFPSSIRAMHAMPARGGVVVGLTSWLMPTRWHRLDETTMRFEALSFGELSAPDHDGLRIDRVQVRSDDGTPVGLTIISRRDHKRDGSAPGWLAGYGAYGLSIVPRFDPETLLWAMHGGVVAYCHARGGGERGAAWHLAGRREQKENGVSDFLACGRHLIEARWTSAERLTAHGRSAGGILVGGALTRAPEMFAAAILAVPVVNLVRFEYTEGGPANLGEFGSVQVPENARWMLASDPFHRVQTGGRYPSVMLTGSDSDVRVPLWQPAKLAARLQAMSASGAPVVFRVLRGGHGISQNQEQAAEELADMFGFALMSSGIDPLAFLEERPSARGAAILAR